ncbi:N-acetylmuramic acid 6-phosphate etherase MurQ [Penicillium sp. IBT 16267x]|nr:N-acetylmuramic acid 6-phosphate etherase MurQ [Penicillium sp. IBT 16267x]
MPSGTEPTELNYSFRSVWIGLAGMDRSGLQSVLAPKLGESFGLDHTTPDLKLTNDVSLLTAAVASNQRPSVIAVIAGTGSGAGGWGHLLGDEGGGYSIGLEAIKHTLEVLEERSLGLGPKEAGEFEHAVIERLGGWIEGNDNIDLLSEILSQPRAQSVKSRIAGVAETVLKLAGNSTAKGIMDEKVSCIVRKPLRRLINPRSNGYVAPEETELVLAGGLMKDEGYQYSMRQQIAQMGLHFRGIRVVDDVAVMAARCLMS